MTTHWIDDLDAQDEAMTSLNQERLYDRTMTPADRRDAIYAWANAHVSDSKMAADAIYQLDAFGNMSEMLFALIWVEVKKNNDNKEAS